jgi:hypothetical protein
MEKIKKFFTNKEKKVSKLGALRTGEAGVICLIIGIYLSIFTIKTGKIEDIKAPWDTILLIGMMLLGMILIACAIAMIIKGCREYQRYQMENGLFNHNLQPKDIEHLLPEMKNRILQNSVLQNSTIEELQSMINIKRDDLTTNGLRY